ncbi:MAG: VWA-like domain-containing protein [Saprospiraceae bacterium]
MKSINSISKTSVKLLLTEPFYGHFMMGLPKEISTQTETAAVALMNRQSIKLIVNEDFWSSLNDQHRYGLIKHEMLHIVLKHLFLMKSFPNKSLFNIAADIVVNQYIERKQLPDGGILLENFAYLLPMYNINLEKDKDVGYYYHQLDKIFKTSPSMSFEQALKNTSAEKSNGAPQVGISELMSDGNTELDRHKFWSEIENMSEGERKLAEYQANRMIKQTADRVKHKYKNYGNLPGSLAEQLEQILADMKPKFNWRRLLRLFATSSNSTFIKNTIRRPSKRYGTVPGVKVKRRNRLLLAIDTSGSVPNEDLVIFFAEIYFIWKQGAEIQIVECDTHIHQTYNYKGITPVKVHGRGGTSFDAPVKYGNEKFHPDALIYFTDGYASPPSMLPRYPVLWIITSNGMEENDELWNKLPGKKLKMNS